MREISMKAGGDEEHPAEVQHGAQHDIARSHARPQQPERGQVHQNERNRFMTSGRSLRGPW